MVKVLLQLFLFTEKTISPKEGNLTTKSIPPQSQELEFNVFLKKCG